MKMQLTKGGPAGKSSRPPPAIMVGCIALAVLSGLGGIWFIFAGDDRPAAAPASPEAEKLHRRGAERSAEMRAAASRLEQKAIGEGYEFDGDGRLLGAAADEADLPQNRTLTQLSAGSPGDATADIRQGVRHRSRAYGNTETYGRRVPTGAASARASADRGLLTQSMLAYSTVGSAGWAERRPD